MFLMTWIRNDFSRIKWHTSVLNSAHREPCEGQGGKEELLTNKTICHSLRTEIVYSLERVGGPH